MDYLYENLGDERFQEFCTALIGKEFKDIQAFPVKQPDGGRDFVSYITTAVEKEFYVFQVKFVRNPYQITDVHKWFKETMEGEVEKIDKIIPKGAIKYYLLTNVKGTAHLDNGSIDKVNKLLEEKITIPSVCWWRDDLSRMIEKDPLFKWSFPEIINGQDILNSILFNYLNENKERRENVIRAYLADQYKLDNEVKFRQVDLQNKLLDLFTDVPIKVKKYNEKNKGLKRILGSLTYYHKRLIADDDIYFEERESMGAAEFLLNSKVQNDIKRILLEGGPGQGKSTISQYISQVHRARLLNRIDDIGLLPEKLKKTPVRLPFKIDLRHIAAWVENKNPYMGTLSDEYFLKMWKNSLEAFLVWHTIYHSQIDDFSTQDLISICKLSPVLFVFDGFDEIANLKVREEVIDFINKGVHRITENGCSIQVLITSRPAVFSDSIGFSIDAYPHFQLTDITPTITKQYVEKWIKANRLDSKEGAEIKRLVNEKLEMPHLKELAKSPMQLAIFISLLRTKGESLPNKRTALYDSYIELFFDRESEKSTMIRDNRDLIIEIHQYLGWILHSEAELYKNSGSIQIDDLKKRLKEYLLKEGHQTDITDKLFDVVKDRVCALASRVQGTFEFEVQPLREYFCAKYLYKTSPYSPAGETKTGTLPDRFEAISRNFYWQNVVRFFAGCFNKGELPMLIQKLKELQNDKVLKFTNYPRILTSQLLSDYVFTQYPLLLTDVVKIIIDGINVGNVINQESRRSNNEPILLPTECGRKEVVIECFNQLKKFPHNDYGSELIGLIKNNPYRTIEIWQDFLFELTGEAFIKWLEYGYKLEIIHKINEETIINILETAEKEEAKRVFQLIIDGNRIDIVNKVFKFKAFTFENILESNLFVFSKKFTNQSLNCLTIILNPFILSQVFKETGINSSLLGYISLRWHPHNLNSNHKSFVLDIEDNDEIDRKIIEFINASREVLELDVASWRNDLMPWDTFIENARTAFNDTWGLNIIATIAAAIKSKGDVYEEFSDLEKSTLSLCKRIRCARLKSGNPDFWQEKLKGAKDIKFVLLVFFTWATPKTVFELKLLVSSILSSFEISDYIKLIEGVKKTVTNSYYTKVQMEYVEGRVKVEEASDRLKYLLSLRFKDNAKQKFIYTHINSYPKELEEITEFKLQHLIEEFLISPENDSLLTEIKKAYKSIINYSERYYFYRRYHELEDTRFPLEVAKKIMIECKQYPIIIASLAEKTCRYNALNQLVAVGEVSEKERWFLES